MGRFEPVLLNHLTCLFCLGGSIDNFGIELRCHDHTLMYPYRNSTITSTVLYSVGLGLPLLAILLGELVRNYYCRYRYRYKQYCLNNNVACKNRLYFAWDVVVPSLICLIYAHCYAFLLGAALSYLITDTAKYSVGRLQVEPMVVGAAAYTTHIK